MPFDGSLYSATAAHLVRAKELLLRDGWSRKRGRVRGGSRVSPLPSPKLAMRTGELCCRSRLICPGDRDHAISAWNGAHRSRSVCRVGSGDRG